MNLGLLKSKKFYLILIWLAFTSLLAIWWMVLGLHHVDLLAALLPDQNLHWAAQKRMLLWEGMTWVAMLVVGGLTSVYFMGRELTQVENLKTFFASFNHEVKTSLASLRLQAESLKEDLEGQSQNSNLLDRLISDTVRLQIQIENSLYMSSKDAQTLYLEKKKLSTLISSLRFRWPQMQIHLKGDALVDVDERAFITLVNNLIQNAIIHGEATAINFEIKKGDLGVAIDFYDDGTGFSGNRENLGNLFFRPTSKSGTGMGLYICKDLAKRMSGDFQVLTKPTSFSGFSGVLQLKGAVL